MQLPVSLTYADLLRLFKYCGYVVLVVAAAILFFRLAELQAHPLKVIWQSVSTALALPPLLILLLSKLQWKYSKLAWLMDKRMVHGLWWGELKSEFKPSEGADPLFSAMARQSRSSSTALRVQTDQCPNRPPAIRRSKRPPLVVNR